MHLPPAPGEKFYRSMSHDPLFHSRGTQIAAHLRTQLHNGRWTDRLPPERLLAQQMGVARRTIRAALKELEAEGWIASRGRLGTRITPAVLRAPGPMRSVGFLFHNRQREINMEKHPLVMQVREELEAAGVHLEVHRVAYLEPSRLSASFRDLMGQVRHDLWLLSAPTPVMETWFVEARIPAVVYGMGQPDSPLPTFSVDFKAIGHHAAGEFLRRGFSDLTLLQPRPTNPEDLHTRLGFEASIGSARHPSPTYRHLWHGEDRQSLMRLVDRLLRRGGREPKAWLLMRPEFYFTIHSYLLYRGVRIPEEVALISRNDAAYLKHLHPEPARYVSPSLQVASRFARFVLRILEGHSPKSQRLMADFNPGETLPAMVKPGTGVSSSTTTARSRTMRGEVFGGC